MSNAEVAFTVSIVTSICLSLILAHYLDKHRWLYKKDFRKIWETWTKEERGEFTKLPNFDADIFF